MRDLFTELQYRVAPGFDLDLDRPVFEKRLRDFLRERSEDDTVVVYYTGHGVLDDGRLYLPMADATGDDLTFSSLQAADLTGRLLAGTAPITGEPLIRLKRLLFILDTCHSGATMGDAAQDAQRFLARMRGPDASGLMGMIVAARPSQQAGSGCFTQAFVGRRP